MVDCFGEGDLYRFSDSGWRLVDSLGEIWEGGLKGMAGKGPQFLGKYS